MYGPTYPDYKFFVTRDVEGRNLKMPLQPFAYIFEIVLTTLYHFNI
jgi:hypothetical protein